MTKDKELQKIQRAFGYKLQGNKRMKHIVTHTVSLLPENKIKKVTSHCWFVSSFEESWAFALRGEDLESGDVLIFLSDELLAEPEEQIRWTILHEIGHVVMGHKNAILEPQSKKDIKKQEKEADEFAKSFTKTYN